jgi:plasmid maintenance system antidote protein VapI
MDENLQLGSESGLQLNLKPANPTIKAKGLLWAQGQLCLAGEVLWEGPNNEYIEWTWIDMLAWLGKNWPYLMLEQTYPIPVKPLSASTLLRDAEIRWEDCPQELVENEEEQVFRFLARHDLATGFNGIYLPSLYFMRQGSTIQISVPETNTIVTLPLERIKRDFIDIGNGLAEHAGRDPHERTQHALALWSKRDEALQQKALQLHTGMTQEQLAQVNNDPENDFWEFDVTKPEQETELLAAARMSNGLIAADQQIDILNKIKKISVNQTPELDALAKSINEEFEGTGRPHDQGYWAANKLRLLLALPNGQPVDPEAILRNWNVGIQSLELDNCPVDAIACWGAKHGPAILLNDKQTSTAGHTHGRRSTLAHEICHLLLDRATALPVAEVLNGETPERLEKRARAFAAELLLPRETAANAIKDRRDTNNLKELIVRLTEIFQVSTELVCWQIQNSAVSETLSIEEKMLLKALKVK